MSRLTANGIAFCLVFGLAILPGCSGDLYRGSFKENMPPKVFLTSGPFEGENTVYRVHFYWIGDDPDGAVVNFEFAIVSGDPYGFNAEDTTGLDKWTKTIATDSIFTVKADEYDRNLEINRHLYSRYDKTYTFFLRAVDNLGVRSPVVHRSFTAFTLAPLTTIVVPKTSSPGQRQVLSPLIRFQWDTRDPIDNPWRTQEADSTRYMWCEPYDSIVDEMNSKPAIFEDKWSPWQWVDAPGDSGRSTILGDDEILVLNTEYLFVVQAKDEAGAVTSIFDEYTNVRRFIVKGTPGPLLKIKERYFGSFRFIGFNFVPPVILVPAGFAVNFSWQGDASQYGSVVATYRYGWDICDLDDPLEWDAVPNLLNTTAPPRKFYSGNHTLYVEAVDGFGSVTLAQIEVVIVPIEMQRNLLWVDDYYSIDFVQKLYAVPTEREHDEFWIDICSRAEGFNAESDVYDTADYLFKPPDIMRILKYKNIIWTYSSEDRFNSWNDVVLFVPESLRSEVEYLNLNILALYVKLGGHLWTLGRSDRHGGLAAVLYANQSVIPRNLRCEIARMQSGCEGDTSGVECMAYRDYCVTVLDKVVGKFRSSEIMPKRDIELDAMYYGFRDDSDPVTAAHPGLPRRLQLWEEVTKPGRHFDPMVRGFTYVEVYNPAYWMTLMRISPQACFHPMYRIKCRYTQSVIDEAAIGLWVTKHEDVVSEAPGAVAAPSVHMGFPLWFFDRAQAQDIADVIFEEWQIKANGNRCRLNSVPNASRITR